MCYKIQFYWMIYFQNKMAQYKSLKVKLSNSQLDKLKSAIKKLNWNSFEIIIKYDW